MRTRSTAVLLLFGLSGVAGLGYQVAWTRMFSVGLGHEMPGLLAVVTAFFVGLALGGALLDRVVSRSPVPGRWFAALEGTVAAWAILIALVSPWLNDLAASLMGAAPTPTRQWTIAFLIPTIALLPATVAMGGTLPAIERLAARIAGRGTTVAGLYAANTLGAMVGILLSATVLIPQFGLRATVFALAAVDIVCGLAIWLGPAADERERPPVTHAFRDAPGRLSLAALLLATGLLGIGFEVAGVRVIGQVLENTIYTYATTVAVYLLGTALGAAAWQRFGPTDRFVAPAGHLLGALAAAAAIGMAAMAGTESIYNGVRAALAPSMGGAAASIAAEVMVALAVFGPVTVVMGATFSHLVLAARRPEGGIGRAMAINTLGSALAPPLVGVILIPAVGARWTLTAIVAGYLLLLPLLHVAVGRAAAATANDAPPRGLRRTHLVLPLLTLTMLAFPVNLQLVRPPAGMRFIPDGVREGVMATVAVAENERGERVLKVNNQFNMGGTAFSFGDRRQGHIPMLLHPDPQSVLFLGVGSGLTAGAATLHGDVDVTAVELVPEIVSFLPRFAPANRLTELDRVVTADARRFVRADEGTYDVVIADLFHPARDGAGNLYTREHFAAVRERLAEGGLFCQWLPLYQLDAPVVATITRTFLEVFPDASGWIGTYNPATPMLGLIGRVGPATDAMIADTAGETDEAWLAGLGARRDPRLPAELTQLALSRPLDLLACRMTGPAGLRTLAGPGPLNRDDRPEVVFAAPWHTYATTESGVGRMEELLALPDRNQFEDERLEGFLRARDAFLRSRIALGRGDLDASWDGLLEAMNASPEFRTAAVVGTSEAQQLGLRGLPTAAGTMLPPDPARAIAFLERIIAARPELVDPRRVRASLIRSLPR